jgi:nucleoside-triphosphatase THEP1
MTRALVALLSGPIGVGKTSVASRVADLAARRGYRVGGILAPALVGSRGRKIGIWAEAVRSGERRVLARTDLRLRGPRVGPYAFDAGVLAWANAALARDLPWADLLLVDEIGKLELGGGEGLAAILPQPDMRRTGLGTTRRALVVVRATLLPILRLRLEGLAPVTFRVTQENRDHLAPGIADWLFSQPGRVTPR